MQIFKFRLAEKECIKRRSILTGKICRALQTTKACVSKFLGKQELTDLYLILIVGLVSEMNASKVFIKKALKKETNSAFISEIHQ